MEGTSRTPDLLSPAFNFNYKLFFGQRQPVLSIPLHMLLRKNMTMLRSSKFHFDTGGLKL